VFADGGLGSDLPATVARDIATRPADAFASLVTVSELNPGVVLLAILASAILGGIHAASPGHGKTVMAAYIVGTRGTFVHALALALSVTVSHTAGVLALGAITVFASNVILPERLYPWLTLASGLTVLVIGVVLLLRVLTPGSAAAALEHAHHHRDHGHDHPHDHGQSHDHGHDRRRDLLITWRTLFALGLAGGILPSASALVVLLGALALERLGFGAGMAIVLTATGVLIAYAGRLAARFFPETDSPLRRTCTRAVPFVSALMMTLIGVVVTVQALGQFGLLPV
jgi:nickel/cobalt exporter